MRNCYCKHSKLSSFRFRQILRLFALDLTASDAARLSGVSVRSINEIYLKLRERLARECERCRPFKGGEVEIDLADETDGDIAERLKRARAASGL